MSSLNRERLYEEGGRALTRLQQQRSLQTERVLDALGLQWRRSAWDRVLPIAGFVGAGALLGAAALLLLAPGVVVRRVRFEP
jgi:hypothetical protein